MARESLILDAFMFANEYTCQTENGTSLLLNQPAMPDYIGDMVNLRMKEAWFFMEPAMKHEGISFQPQALDKGVKVEDPVSAMQVSFASSANLLSNNCFASFFRVPLLHLNLLIRNDHQCLL